MKKIFSLILLLIITLQVASCKVNDTSSFESLDNLSSECELESFLIESANNVWLFRDLKFRVTDSKVISVFDSYPCIFTEPLVLTFEHTGSLLLVDGKVVISGSTPVLLSETTIITVVAQDGTKKNYSLNTYDSSNGLPAFFINTVDGDAVTSRFDYKDATISVIGSKGKSFYSAAAQIRVRGNSTAGYDKKPYRIKFELAQDVLGMGKYKSWVMLALFFDRTLIRTEIVTRFANKLDGLDYVPDMQLAEVYLNNEYVGVYDIGHQIDVDDGKVEIEQGSSAVDTGYLLETDARYTEEGYELGVDCFMLGSSYMCICSPETVTKEQYKYISEYLNRVNRLLIAKSEYVWNYIDMDSFIDWYIVNELTRNVDSAMFLSCRMYKEAGGLLYMGPIWDFDLSCGNADYGDMENPEGWYVRHAVLFTSLFKYTEFRQALKDRWNELIDTAIPEIFEDIDYYEASIKKAYNANFKKWSIFGTYIWPTPAVIVTYTTQKQHYDYLRNYLTLRIEWLDKEINALT
ncbi:MAG TPA: CotH kinase family protein [Bacillota bacterium]|nr:CotH kinase family protein [Bacillota bacterium]